MPGNVEAKTADVRRVEIDARVGGKFTLSDMRKKGEAVHWGDYPEIDRPRKLAFTWFTSEEEENNAVVTLTIEPLAGGCRATRPTGWTSVGPRTWSRPRRRGLSCFARSTWVSRRGQALRIDDRPGR